ncbi:MAG: hypothetical protein AB2693_22095 [Candidatus Thiodiazotropha sp.]
MTNSATIIQGKINVNGKVLGTLTMVKYLGAIVFDEVYLKDCTNHCSFDKAEANLDRE